MKNLNPSRVRYIKLGEGGTWERECIERGILRFSFGSGRPHLFAFCRAGQWDEARAVWVNDGRGGGTATRFAGEARYFFEDDGTTLWITFYGECLWWCFLEPSPPEQYGDNESVFRRTAGSWRCTDLHGEQLSKDRLSGALTKLSGYRGTSCSVDVSDYVTQRINGRKVAAVERALTAYDELRVACLGLMRLLGWKDFEVLVDLVFSTSGWRRQGIIGKTQKTLDLDLLLPSTGERAFVQIKSRTTSGELAAYVEQFSD